MRNSSPAQLGSSSPTQRQDGDGNQVRNYVLLSLPRKEWDLVLPKIELVRLKLRQVIHEPHESLKSGYFCNSGMFSILCAMPDGKSVEVGLIGKEGFSTVPLIAGFRTSSTRVIVQSEGTAFRIDAAHLRGLLRDCPVMEHQLQRFGQLLTTQTMQIAACNRLHEVDERLARWLLMTQDRIGSPSLPLTQEFIAQMLGTRRSTVTVSAGTLQKAGLITYTRGNVTILNRSRLEESACECYRSLTEQVQRWQTEDERPVR